MEKESLSNTGRGINIVFVSKALDHDRKLLEEILAKASGILGCDNCHSGKKFVPVGMGDPGPDLERLGNLRIENIFIANKAGIKLDLQENKIENLIRLARTK